MKLRIRIPHDKAFLRDAKGVAFSFVSTFLTLTTLKECKANVTNVIGEKEQIQVEFETSIPKEKFENDIKPKLIRYGLEINEVT